ncbi:MAG TPA: pyridoxal-phosphate dependent enzyme, partial [Roseiflexaceae bacterium]|nr:pyridoxal-phosphate dependent enzyme [Roseiflexaceae bacterium]
ALGTTAIVFVPEHAAPAKVAAMQARGATVRFAGDDALIAELAAREYAKQQQLAYLSPYNDLDVIAGQGTIALELLDQTPPLDTIVVAVGGGGLVAGVAATLKAYWPAIQVIGALPAASP